MAKENPQKSLFEGCKITVGRVMGCPCMGHLTRAVIELSDDISFAMPIMQRVIDGCGYNAEASVAAFRYQNMGVIVHKNEIIINNAEDEATARTVIEFLKDIVDSGDKITGKVRAY
jgi:hypothetical protein